MTEPAIPRLAVYGTLAPGRSNHDQLDRLDGRWVAGTVRGTLSDQGWGSALGFPAITLDADGSIVDVQVFESHDLTYYWDRLDAFEGPAYRRVPVQVATAEGELLAYIYELMID